MSSASSFHEQMMDLVDNPPCIRQRLLKSIRNTIEWDILHGALYSIIDPEFITLPGFQELPDYTKSKLLSWLCKILSTEGFVIEKDFAELIRVEWKN